MSNKFHKNFVITDGIHCPISYEYADEATRLAATGFVATDVRKFARQLDNNFVYMLVNHSPATWQLVSSLGVPSGTAGGDLGGTYPNPTVNDGADSTAIHDNVAGEVSAITEKISPVSGDLVVIEDSAASYTKKKVQIGNFPVGADEKVKVSVNDTTAGYLDAKITAADESNTINILEIKEVNDGGDEDLKIAIDESKIDHTALQNKGTNTHAQIDTHVSSTSNPHSTDIDNLGSGTLSELNGKITDATLDDSSDSRPPSGAAGGDLGGTYPNPTVNDGSDSTAIHDNVSGEINLVAEKVSPVSADIIVIEDSAASYAKKKIQVGNLPSGSGADEKVKVSANDTTEGYLDAKLIAADESNTVNILELKEVNDGGDEDLKIAIDEAKINHVNILNNGTNTHAQIDSHIANTSNPHATDIGNLGTGTLAELNGKITDATLDDSSDSRPPSGAAGGDLGGTYPNPTVDDGADSTAIHDNVAGEINAIAEKTAPVPADLVVIEDSAASNNKKKVQAGRLPVFPTYYITAPMMDMPNNSDWTVNAHAENSTDSNNAALSVLKFDDSTEEGAGFDIYIPTGATNIVIALQSRAETAPGSAQTVALTLYNREFKDNVAQEAWTSAMQMTDINIPTNEYWQNDSETIALSILGITAGNDAQFEITRDTADAGDTLSGDWTLRRIRISFT